MVYLTLLRIENNYKAIIGFQKLRRLRRNGSLRLSSYLSRSIIAWKIISFSRSYNEMCEYFLFDICSAKESNDYSLIPFMGRILERYTWPKEWWTGGTVMLPFEDIMVPCPKEYDKILTHQFGNYHEFQKGTALHSLEIMDPYRPYQEVLAEYYASNPK